MIITADVGGLQNIFENSIIFYKNDDKIRSFLEKPFENSISKMEIAPPYKVKI